MWICNCTHMSRFVYIPLFMYIYCTNGLINHSKMLMGIHRCNRTLMIKARQHVWQKHTFKLLRITSSLPCCDLVGFYSLRSEEGNERMRISWQIRKCRAPTTVLRIHGTIFLGHQYGTTWLSYREIIFLSCLYLTLLDREWSIKTMHSTYRIPKTIFNVYSFICLSSLSQACNWLELL